MKKFEFPQIFKPIVGDISFEINSPYQIGIIEPLATNRYLNTYRDLKLPSSNENSKSSTRKYLSTTKNLSIIADSMVQETRQQKTNKRKVLDYLSQINQKCREKNKQPTKERANKVKFNDMVSSSNILVLESQRKVTNQFKSRRIVTEQSKQNIQTQIEEKEEINEIKAKVKRRQAMMRTSIQENKTFAEEILRYSDKMNLKTSSKSKRKLSEKGSISKKITRRNSKANYPLQDELDKINFQCQENLKENQLEISSRGTNQNSFLSGESSQKIKKSREQYKNQESDLMSIPTEQLDREYSDTDLGRQKFSIRKMRRNNSILELSKRKGDPKKSLLRKINTMHFLETYSDEEEQQAQSENKLFTDKSRYRIKFLQFLAEGKRQVDPPVIIPKKRKLTKKVTFFEKNQEESQGSISQGKSQKPSVERAKEKRKCIIRLRNYKTSLELSSNLIPEFSESESIKQRKYMLPNFQKKWNLQKTNSSQLIPLDTNVYNELNYFFTRIYQNNQNKAQEGVPAAIESSQPIHMTISNNEATLIKQRLGNLNQEHKMIDLGVRLTRGKKLLQKPV